MSTNPTYNFFFHVAISGFLSLSCATKSPSKDVLEEAIRVIELKGVISSRHSEISGLTWYKDYLILLPQYPDRFDNNIFAIHKPVLLDYIDGVITEPITPQTITFNAPQLQALEDYEGLEAIVSIEDTVYISIETSPASGMMGYIGRGYINDDLSQITLTDTSLAYIHPQSKLPNLTEETLFTYNQNIFSLHEANGLNVNPSAFVHRFTDDLSDYDSIPMVSIEYRITDATQPDAQGKFWVINYLWSGDKAMLDPAKDFWTENHGVGASHSSINTIERLLELQITDSGITATDSAPIWFQLREDGESRNWEGLVRFNERNGFLVATDKYPATILGFVRQ